MKRLLWLSIFCLSLSWLFALPIYNPVDAAWWLGLLGLGVLFAGAGFFKASPDLLDQRYLLVLLFPSTLISIIAYPYTIGGFLLSIGIIIALIRNINSSYRFLQVFSYSFLFAGLLLLIQAPLLFLFSRLSLFSHRIDLFSLPLSAATNLFGLSTTVNNGLLYLQTYQSNVAFSITWEKLGLFPFLFFLVGAVALIVLFSHKKQWVKQITLLAVSAGIYLILRFIFLLFLYADTRLLTLFWDPVVSVLSFFPLVLFCMRVFPMHGTWKRFSVFQTWSRTRKQGAIFVCFFVGFVLLIGSIGYSDVGLQKQGRVLIDEYHSDWEDSVRAMDTEWYGLLSTYNYYSWAEWLKAYYAVEQNLDQTLSSALLKDVDVLVLKCPTVNQNTSAPYSSEEIQAVHTFVEEGGGLFLIGDHTDVFGMNTFLNRIIEPLGLRLNTDAVYELGTGNYTIFTPSDLFSHPTVYHMDRLDFLTSCSLQATQLSSLWRVEPAIIGTQVISEPGTYSTENFFRESVSSPDASYGYILQSAALKKGQGRIFVFTDSTVFSSFTVFSDGYQSFSLGIFDFLNHKNSTINPNMILFLGSLICLLVALYLLQRQNHLHTIYLLLLAGMCAFLIATPTIHYLNTLSHPLPEQTTSYPQIYFDQTYSNATFTLKPTIPLLQEQDTYDTFYVWTQRLGYVPTYQHPLHQARDTAEILIFINPHKPFETPTLTHLTNYLEKGGHILLIDSITNTHSTAHQLLQLTNMQLIPSQHTSNNKTTPYLSIQGGTPLYTDTQNHTYASYARVQNTSKGILLVCVDSEQFKDEIMGGVFTQPTPEQQKLYTLEYLLLDHLHTTTP